MVGDGLFLLTNPDTCYYLLPVTLAGNGMKEGRKDKRTSETINYQEGKKMRRRGKCLSFISFTAYQPLMGYSMPKSDLFVNEEKREREEKKKEVDKE